MSDQIPRVLSFSNKRKILSLDPKTLLYPLRKGEITTMDKGKNIQTEQTKEEIVDIRKQRERRLCDLLFPLESPELENIE